MTKKKRYRAPRAKDGELKMQWGKLPHDDPDICVVWGAGASRADGALLHWMFSGKRARLAYGGERPQYGPPIVYDDSFIEELEKRGYDITTIKFSIQKKRVPDASDN